MGSLQQLTFLMKRPAFDININLKLKTPSQLCSLARLDSAHSRRSARKSTDSQAKARVVRLQHSIRAFKRGQAFLGADPVSKATLNSLFVALLNCSPSPARHQSNNCSFAQQKISRDNIKLRNKLELLSDELTELKARQAIVQEHIRQLRYQRRVQSPTLEDNSFDSILREDRFNR